MPLLRAPDGQIVDLPDAQSGQAIAGGYTPVSIDQAAQVTAAPVREDSGALSGIGALATSTLSGITLGASDYALRSLLDHGAAERMARDRELHPVISGAGQVLGSIAPALVGGPLASSPAGLLSRTAAGVAEGGGAARVLAAAGIEGAGQNAGMYLADSALGDRKLSAEGLAGALGSGFAFGTAGGAVALGIERGAIAARRLFSRVTDGTERAATEAEQAWQAKYQTTLEANDAAAEIARAKLAEAQMARMQAAVARDRAAAGVADARASAPAADAAHAAAVRLDDNLAKIEAQERARAAQAAASPESPAGPVAPADGGIPDALRTLAGVEPETAAQRYAALDQAAEAELARAVAEHDAARAELDDVLSRLDAPDVGMAGGAIGAHKVPIAEFGAPGERGIKVGAELEPRPPTVVEAATGDRTVVGRKRFAEGTPAEPTAAPPAGAAERPVSAPEPRAPRAPGDVPAGFGTSIASDSGQLFEGEPKIRTGIPSRRQVNRKNFRSLAFVVKPSELADRGVLGVIGEPVSTAERVGSIRSAWSSGTELSAVEIDIDKAGRYFIASGNKRVLAAAAEGDRPVLVRFRPIAGDVGSMDPLANQIKNAIAGRPLDAAIERPPGTFTELRELARKLTEAIRREPPRNADEAFREWWSLDRGKSSQKLPEGWWSSEEWQRSYRTEVRNPRVQELVDEVLEREPAPEAASRPRNPAGASPGPRRQSGGPTSSQPLRKDVVVSALVASAIGKAPGAAAEAAVRAPIDDLGEPHSIASTTDAIARNLGIEHSEARQLVNVLRDDALIDSRGQVTQVGRAIVAADAGDASAIAALRELRAAPEPVGDLESLLRGTQQRLDAGEKLVDMGAPSREAYQAAKAERTAAAAERFRGEAMARSGDDLGAGFRRAVGEAGDAAPWNEGVVRGRTEGGYAGSPMAAAERDLQAAAAAERGDRPLTWPEFSRERLVDYIAEEGTQAKAMKRLSQEWREYKASIAKPLEAAQDAALERAAIATDPAERAVATAEAHELERQLAHVGAEPGAVEQIAAVADAVTKYERASAKLTEALGEEAPPAAKAAAQEFRAAEQTADRKVMERATRAIDDHVEANPPPGERVGRDRRPEANPPGRELIARAQADKASADAAYARARAAESEARASAHAASKTARDARAEAMAARPKASTAHGDGSRLGSIATAIGVAGELGVPGVPHPKDIPVIGPLLSMLVKYRAVRAAAGRFHGRIPATGDARAAALAARTKDKIATAVDRTLGLVASAAPKARGAVIATTTVLARRVFDDGEPDAPRGASAQKLAAVRIREIAAAASRPELVSRMVRRELRGVADPDLIAAAEQHMIAMFQHLASVMPKMPPPNPFSKTEWVPSPAAAHELGERLAVVDKPELAIANPTPATADTLRNLYPQLYAWAKQRLLERVGDLTQPVPYQQLLRASMLFQVPLVSSTAPDAVAAFQAAHTAMRAPSTPAPAPGAPPVPSIAGSTDLSSIYQPAGDRRAARM